MTTVATQSAIRNPPSTIEGKLINDLADPNMTLGDVAYLHDLSLENLTLWIVRPDITERLKALTDSIYLRVRLAAITHLATTVNALNTMIGAYIDEERHAPVNPSSIQDREQRRRARETARKAIALLSRLAHLPAERRETNPRRVPLVAAPHPSNHQDLPKPPPVVHHTTTEAVDQAPNPITPRNLHDRAGQPPAATLSLFSLYPFGEDLGWDRARDLCACLPLNTRPVEHRGDVRTSPERLSDGEQRTMSEAVERSDRLSDRLRSPLTQSFGARLNVQESTGRRGISATPPRPSPEGERGGPIQSHHDKFILG